MNKNDVIKEFEEMVRYLNGRVKFEPDRELTSLNFNDCLPIYKAALAFMKSEYPNGVESYPRNLLMKLGILPLEEDLERLSRNLEYTLNTLDERDRVLILAKYKDGLSEKEIQGKYGIAYSAEKLHRAMYALRTPLRIKYICAGEDAVLNYEKIKADFVRETAELEEQIGKLKRENLSSIISAEELDSASIYKTSVDDLNLSTRSRNALFRAGYKTIGDFRGKTMADMLKIRNLGETSRDEVMQALEKYGIFIENPYKY